MKISKAHVDNLTYGTACAISDILLSTLRKPLDVGLCVSQVKNLTCENYRRDIAFAINGVAKDVDCSRGIDKTFAARLRVYFGLTYAEIQCIVQNIPLTDLVAVGDLFVNLSILRRVYNG